MEPFLGAYSFKQTTGQKPGSIWAHEDCKTFGAEWKKTPESSARRFQLSCTCAKCFAAPLPLSLEGGLVEWGGVGEISKLSEGICHGNWKTCYHHWILVSCPVPSLKAKWGPPANLSTGILSIWAYLTFISSYHISPWTLKTTSSPAPSLKSLSWALSWITPAHHRHQIANYFKEIIYTLRQFVICKNVCGRKYMFLKGRTPKMFSDESVKMSKHRWHDTDHEKVNLKLSWNVVIMFSKEGEFRGREVLLGPCTVVLKIKSSTMVYWFPCIFSVHSTTLWIIFPIYS